MARRFAPFRWQVCGSLVMVLVLVGTSIVSPLLLQRVIDDALPHRDGRLLALLCVSMIGAGLLGSVVTVAETALTNWIGQRVVANLRVEVYDRARTQPLHYYTAESESEIQTRLVSDIEGVDGFITHTAQSALAATTSLVTALVVMVILSWPLALVSMTLAVLLSLLNNRFARRRRVLAKRRQEHLATVLRFVAEDLSLGGVILGRTLRRTGRQRARFVEVCERIQDTTYRQRIAGTVAYAVIGASFALVSPAIYWVGGSIVPGLSVGAIVVLVVLQTRLAGPIQSLLQLSGSLQASIAMFERVLEYLGPAPASDAPRSARPCGIEGGVALRLRGVSHSFEGSGRPVLLKVDLDIPAGSVTVVVGPTGSGKSTLGLIMAGLVSPGEGTVEISGSGFTDAERLREVATLIPQHPTLFNTSIIENLRFARDNIPPHELDQVIRLACLDELVTSSLEGYDTPVGQAGHRLSGGERQRLAIARALLADSPLLVADEVTSALDGATAERVHEALRERGRGRTLVVIAHRIPRLAPGDFVVMMDHGRVVEHGTHASLSKRSDAYRAILETQYQASR
ncbi:ABC transporter ATP-binding protein [Nonomuraea sp. NPDC050536]|uniref:ABC transporter ATP-binding protein n=1 Tax=Nonomuraea sp. NPDC050536 TaxID=3364366 RepID=UPI0037C694AC